VGPQYRSIIMYTNEQQKEIAQQVRSCAFKAWHTCSCCSALVVLCRVTLNLPCTRFGIPLQATVLIHSATCVLLQNEKK
jgi:hypothetical protein